jgi:hypothetical protein
MNMNSDTPEARSLHEIEIEVLAEGREWMRQRLQQKLQAEADRQGGVFPPQRSQGLAPAKSADAFAQRRRRH